MCVCMCTQQVYNGRVTPAGGTLYDLVDVCSAAVQQQPNNVDVTCLDGPVNVCDAVVNRTMSI